ncbi:MAG TPA: 3'-5' exonuclease [Pseudonocardiaceae bacterium]|nr:3'-5' exonuclease [Pseudonocardiaceae bacterium]
MVDVEGNGQRPPDLVELAVVPIVGGVIQEPLNWMVRPGQPITPMARRIHGISNEDVDGADTFNDVADSVRQALDVDALVAHAAHVDVGVLQRKLGDWDCPEIFDTLKLARRLLPDRDSYKLGALAEALSLVGALPSRLKPHRAEYDAIVCARLFMYLAGRHSLEELRDLPPGGTSDEAPALF